MDTLMIPVMQAPKAPVSVETQREVRTDNGSNFSSYLARKSASDRQRRQNLLGADQHAAQAGRASRTAPREQPQESNNDHASEDSGQAATVAGLLAQLMNDLRQAADTTAPATSEWSFSITDPSQLQKLAKSAGLSDAELAALTQKMQQQGGTESLSDLFTFLSRHFNAMQDQQPVTTPETDLPMLENFLERVGVPAEEASRIGEAAVRGDNTIDLEKLLQGLDQLHSQGITTLSPAEAEQLQEMLAQAGVSLPTQYSLLPERLPLWQEQAAQATQQELPVQAQQLEQPIHLTLERLQNMLRQGVADVKGSRLQADLPTFLSELQTVLNRSGLESRSPGWTPAVQGAVTSAFEKLMQSVDLAQVRVQQGNRLAEAVADRRAEADLLAEQAGGAEGVALDGAALAEEAAGQDHLAGGGHNSDRLPGGQRLEAMDLLDADTGMLQSDAVVSRHDTGVQATSTQSAAPRPFVTIPGMPLELQNQGFSQISQGVLQGLRNQQHHLVLKLYPKELGEVRVEMTVREDQVAVSFAMENSKVKQVLESNLEQFRQNMEQQGFMLGECMVSVNQNNAGNESWRQFQDSWQAQGGSGAPRAATLADLPDEVLYQRVGQTGGRENGVDLFA